MFFFFLAGHDSGTGTVKDPFKTVAAAVSHFEKGAKKEGRSSTGSTGSDGGDGSDGKCIVLRGGLHHLTETITLGPSLSGLTIMNYPKEAAWVSGGVALTGAPPPFHILPLVWLFALGKGNMGTAWALYCRTWH